MLCWLARFQLCYSLQVAQPLDIAGTGRAKTDSRKRKHQRDRLRMALLNQPTELLLLIASFLSSYSDLSNLTKSCKLLHTHLTSLLYHRDHTKSNSSALSWAAQNCVPATFRRALQAGISINGRNATTLLHQAAEFDSVEIIQLLLESGVFIDAQSETQSTALHTALRSWSWGAAKCLLQAGAAVNAGDDEQDRPLHLQAVIIPVELVQMMIMSGADPTAPNYGGWTCAAVHAFHGRAATLAILLDAGADVYDRTSGAPLVMLAAASGKQEALQLLLDRGADISVQNEELLTVFHVCILREKFGCAKILLDHGADIDLPDGNGATALHAAIERSSQKQVEFLLAHGASISTLCDELTPLQCAVTTGCYEVVKILLEKGSDVALCEAGQRPPLCTAARRGYTEIVRLLLMWGASAYFTDARGCTMLQFANEANSPDIFKLLLESGTDVDRVGRDGCSPLYRAVWHGSLEIVALLVAHGTNVNSEADGDWSPIKQAASNGNLPILEYLVRHGANTEADTVGQKSSLVMLASAHGKVDVVKWLLTSTGLKAQDVDAFGRTALHYAARTGKTLVVQFFTENHPNILKVQDLMGATAFMLAARNGQTAVIRSLLYTIGTSALADRDDGDHSPIYWAKKCREDDAAQLLSNYSIDAEVNLPADFAEEKDNCQVHINAKACYCDICGCHSTAPPNIEAFECHECFSGEEAFVVICGICARDREKCLESGHNWVKHICDCTDEEGNAEERRDQDSSSETRDESENEDEQTSSAAEDESEDENEQESSGELED